MYTDIAAAINSTKTLEELRSALFHQFGNCSHPLRHRAGMNIEMETPGAVDMDVWPPGQPPDSEDVATAITVNNTTSTYNEITQVIEGGITVFAPGVSWFQYLLVDFLISQGFDWRELDVVTDITLNDQSCTLSVTKERIKVLAKTPTGGIVQHQMPVTGQQSPPQNFT